MTNQTKHTKGGKYVKIKRREWLAPASLLLTQIDECQHKLSVYPLTVGCFTDLVNGFKQLIINLFMVFHDGVSTTHRKLRLDLIVHLYHLLTIKILGFYPLFNYTPSFFTPCLRTRLGSFRHKIFTKKFVKSPFLSLCVECQIPEAKIGQDFCFFRCLT